MNVRRLVSRVSVGVVACGGLWFAACVADQAVTGPSDEDSGTGNDGSVSADGTPGGDGGAGDGGGDSSAPDAGDAGDGAVKTTCDMAAPFTNIHAVTELNTLGNDQHARLSQNELEVWFSSTGLDAGPGGGQYDLFHANRTTATGTFVNIKGVSGPNTIYSESAPAVDGDLLQIVYASTLATTGGTYDLYRSTRSGLDAGFQAGFDLSISGTGNDLDPYLAADDQTLYFSSDRAGGYTIYRSQHSGGGNLFGAPAIVTELSSGVNDTHPVISADGLWIYWSSQRIDIGGHKGGDDIYVAHRPTVPGTFAFTTNVMELNTTDNDAPTWISPDGCRLYFARKPTAGTSDIWVAERAL